MQIKHLLLGLACALTATMSAADTTFTKPEYRITLPGTWKDASDRESDAFQSASGSRELTATFMALKQPLEGERLKEILVRLLEQRAQAHKQIDGPGAKFEGPNFAKHKQYTTAQLWGFAPSGRRFVTTLFADSGGIKSFTYYGQGMPEDGFRAEAVKVLGRLEFK